MRVSDQMFNSVILSQLQRQNATLLSLQEQISSGRKLTSLSDDPSSLGVMLSANNTLSATNQQLKNIGEAKTFLSAAETAIAGPAVDTEGGVLGALGRARDIAIKMSSSGIYGAADRLNEAKNVGQIFDELVGLANTSINGRFIFAGGAATTTPFSSRGAHYGLPITTPLEITAASNTLMLTLNGGVQTAISLPVGIYATPAAVIQMVQEAINNTVPGGGTQVSGGDVTIATSGNSANLQYSLGQDLRSGGQVEILNSMGKVVRTIFGLGFQGAGLQTVQWDGKDDVGGAAPVGTYTFRVFGSPVVGEVSVVFDTDHLVITSNEVGGISSVVIDPASSAAGILGLTDPDRSLAAGSYLGDDNLTSVLIGPGSTVTTNISGDTVFDGGGDPTRSVMGAVSALQAALMANDTVAIQAALDNINTAREHVIDQVALIGARLERVGATEENLKDFKLVVERQRSESGDVDITKLISDLAFQESTLNATRQVAAMILSKTLLDFIQ